MARRSPEGVNAFLQSLQYAGNVAQDIAKKQHEAGRAQRMLDIEKMDIPIVQKGILLAQEDPQVAKMYMENVAQQQAQTADNALLQQGGILPPSTEPAATQAPETRTQPAARMPEGQERVPPMMQNYMQQGQGMPQQAPQEIPQEQAQPIEMTPEQKIEKLLPLLSQAKTPAAKRTIEKAIDTQQTLIKAQATLQREASKEERENRKEAAPFIKETIDAYKGAIEEDVIVGQMKQLVEKGNLITPALNKLFNTAGVPLGVLENPDVEEFDKLSNYLTRGISKYFPGRINIIEFQNFLRQIPTLQNSDEGKIRIIKNLQDLAEPKKIQYKVMKDILAKNGGKTPPNFNFLVSEAMEPYMDQWAKKMTSGFEQANQIATGQPAGSVRMTRNGRSYDIPKDKVESAKAAGFQ